MLSRTYWKLFNTLSIKIKHTKTVMKKTTVGQLGTSTKFAEINKRSRQFPWNKKSEEKVRQFMTEIVGLAYAGQRIPKWGVLVRKYKVNVKVGYRIPQAMENLGIIKMSPNNRLEWTARNWEFLKDGPIVYLEAQRLWAEQEHTPRKKSSEKYYTSLKDAPLDLSPMPEEQNPFEGISLEQIIDELNNRGYEVTIKKSLII